MQNNYVDQLRFIVGSTQEESLGNIVISGDHIKAFFALSQEELDEIVIKTQDRVTATSKHPVALVLEKFKAEALRVEKKLVVFSGGAEGVDPDILSWLSKAKNKVVTTNRFPQGRIKPLTESKVDGDLMENALWLTAEQAVEKITEAMVDGYFDENLKELVIYIHEINEISDRFKIVGFTDENNNIGIKINVVNPAGGVLRLKQGKQIAYLRKL